MQRTTRSDLNHFADTCDQAAAQHVYFSEAAGTVHPFMQYSSNGKICHYRRQDGCACQAMLVVLLLHPVIIQPTAAIGWMTT